ncbi:MAG: STAS domain-containing protein [Acidimicrobiales bacterium]
MSRQSIPAGFPPGGHGPPASPRVAPTTPPSAFLFSVGRALGVVVVTVHGTLDTSGCAQLEHVLEDLIENQNLRVVVDLLDLTRVEEGGWAVFRGAATSASTRGGELILADPCDAVHRALDATGLAPAVSVTRRSTPLRGRCVPSAGEPTPAERWSVTAHPAVSNRYLADQRDEP